MPREYILLTITNTGRAGDEELAGRSSAVGAVQPRARSLALVTVHDIVSFAGGS